MFVDDSNNSYQESSPYPPSNHGSPAPSTTNLMSTLPYANSPHGMGSMIERMNGVQDRSTVPVAKRQKIMEEDAEGLMKSHQSSSSSGLLSGYLKEKQRAEQSMSGLPAARKTQVLDLTAGTYCHLKTPGDKHYADLE